MISHCCFILHFFIIEKVNIFQMFLSHSSVNCLNRHITLWLYLVPWGERKITELLAVRNFRTKPGRIRQHWGGAQGPVLGSFRWRPRAIGTLSALP